MADSVAEINGTQYATLAEAIEAANNEDEIVLLSDMTLDDNTQFIINKNITINWNNHEITASISRVDFGGVFTFAWWSEGSTIKDMIVNFVGTERDNSVIYFFEWFGVNEGTTTVENITVNWSNDQGIVVLTPSLVNGTISIIGNTFKDLKYGMYFNSLNNLIIKNNTIDWTKYNAIHVVEWKNIMISNNTLSNISTENYDDNGFYSAGISFENGVIRANVLNNDIKMLNDKLEIYYDDATQTQKYTVEFKDGDTVISTAEYTNGETIVVPANPTKNGYTFAGWNETPATVMSNSNLTYIAHGATKIPDGVAFSGFTQIQITPPPTWNKAFPIQTKTVAHHGHTFSTIAHKATNQHPSKATNFGHWNLSVSAQNRVCNPNANMLYISIAKNIHWLLSSHLA